jgi:hypothetical protein
MKNWISVKEKKPKTGEQVLVVGYLKTELGGKESKKTIGLVNWGKNKYCSDVCYYMMEYKDITHWKPL